MDNFAAAAAGFPDPFRLLIRDSVQSTNDDVRVLADGGAPEGLVLLGLKQLAGRGRRGAAWFASPGESLAFSILLRPAEPKALWPRLALAAGLAVAEAMESFGLTPGIKWPNDVWLGGKKAAGILVEAGKDFAVVGIGINVNQEAFPPELSEVATSMRIEGGAQSLPDVLGSIIARFANCSQLIGGNFGEMVGRILERCVLTGKSITLQSAGGIERGICEGISDSGELLLRNANGFQRILQADEVRVEGR